MDLIDDVLTCERTVRCGNGSCVHRCHRCGRHCPILEYWSRRLSTTANDACQWCLSSSRRLSRNSAICSWQSCCHLGLCSRPRTPNSQHPHIHRMTHSHTPEQFQYEHVILTEAFVGLAGTDKVSNELWPVIGPLILQYLHHKQQPDINNTFSNISLATTTSSLLRTNCTG